MQINREDTHKKNEKQHQTPNVLMEQSNKKKRVKNQQKLPLLKINEKN